MVFFAARAATWAWVEHSEPATHLSPFGERLFVACLVSLPVLPALALLVLLFTRRHTLPAVLTVVLLLVVGLAGAVAGFVRHWPLFGFSVVSSSTSPDGTQQAHLFTGGLFCSAFLCVGAPREVWCHEVQRRSDLKCQSERIEWTPDGSPSLMGELAEPFHLFAPH